MVSHSHPELYATPNRHPSFDAADQLIYPAATFRSPSFHHAVPARPSAYYQSGGRPTSTFFPDECWQYSRRASEAFPSTTASRCHRCRLVPGYTNSAVAAAAASSVAAAVA
eukprot:ctg_1626.g446